MREKRHGHSMYLDLSKPADRLNYFLGRWHDLPTQLLMRRLIAQGDTVVDVGANRGWFAFVAASLVGPSGKVICFEPNPECFRALGRVIAEDQITNITVHPFGLGDGEQDLTLTVPFFNLGEGTFGATKYDEVSVYKVQAQIRRGDATLAVEKPSLIKIDIEGFECKAIAGLAQTIKRDRPIILTEVIQEHLLACGSSVGTLTKLMEDLGYHGFGLTLRKARQGHEVRVVQFSGQDAVTDVVWFNLAESPRHQLILDLLHTIEDPVFVREVDTARDGTGRS